MKQSEIDAVIKEEMAVPAEPNLATKLELSFYEFFTNLKQFCETKCRYNDPKSHRMPRCMDGQDKLTVSMRCLFPSFMTITDDPTLMTKVIQKTLNFAKK